MNKTLLALYGLKFNPFAPGVPVTALLARVAHIAGYSRFSLTRASAVVNCQSALA
jgi:hypothetical protein